YALPDAVSYGCPGSRRAVDAVAARGCAIWGACESAWHRRVDYDGLRNRRFQPAVDRATDVGLAARLAARGWIAVARSIRPRAARTVHVLAASFARQVQLLHLP